jgi:hypothetical protein
MLDQIVKSQMGIGSVSAWKYLTKRRAWEPEVPAAAKAACGSFM